MVHGDDRGLKLPPKVAPIQCRIVPIAAHKPGVMEKADELFHQLKEAGIRVDLDDREQSAGWKFNECELRGIPVRLEIGPKDIENGKVEDKGKRKTDEHGLISISLPDLKPAATRQIIVEFDDPQYIYKKTFYLPSFTKDFDIKFFPEGGALLAVPHQNIAFKAQGADGLSKEIEGFLFN